MKKICAILIALVICSKPFTCFACTSFAVYSKNILYGMNFDFNDTTILASIEEFNGNKVFTMKFKAYQNWGKNTLMNGMGLFTAVQEVDTIDKSKANDFSLALDQFAMWIPSEKDDVSDVQYTLENLSLRHNSYGTYHAMIADITGQAIVIELIDGETVQTGIEDNFIVMTNFANARLETEDYKKLQGVGSDRYVTVYDYISENFQNFDVESAFEALKRASWSATQYSAVCDPVNRIVYFSIKRSYDKIWKISLDDKTLETFIGFNTPMSYSLDKDGISFMQLLEYQAIDKN